MEQTYGGVVIKYDEDENLWRSEHGKSSSLKGAKEQIDRAQKKEKAFTPIPAWRLNGGWSNEVWQSVTITSVTDERECWISYKEGNKTRREKVYRIDRIYADTPENAARREKYTDLQKQIDAMKAEQDEIMGAMEVARVPKEEGHQK